VSAFASARPDLRMPCSARPLRIDSFRAPRGAEARPAGYLSRYLSDSPSSTPGRLLQLAFSTNSRMIMPPLTVWLSWTSTGIALCITRPERGLTIAYSTAACSAIRADLHHSVTSAIASTGTSNYLAMVPTSACILGLVSTSSYRYRLRLEPLPPEV